MRVVSPKDELARKKLIEDGLPAEAVQRISGTSRNEWQTARLLNAWLDQHPEKQIRVLCDLFQSRRWNLILDRSLAAANRTRTNVVGITDPRYDSTNWWRRRHGIKCYFNNVLRLGYAWCKGEDHLPAVDWSPDVYEMVLMQSCH